MYISQQPPSLYYRDHAHNFLTVIVGDVRDRINSENIKLVYTDNTPVPTKYLKINTIIFLDTNSVQIRFRITRVSSANKKKEQQLYQLKITLDDQYVLSNTIEVKSRYSKYNNVKQGLNEDIKNSRKLRLIATKLITISQLDNINYGKMLNLIFQCFSVICQLNTKTQKPINNRKLKKGNTKQVTQLNITEKDDSSSHKTSNTGDCAHIGTESTTTYYSFEYKNTQLEHPRGMINVNNNNINTSTPLTQSDLKSLYNEMIEILNE